MRILRGTNQGFNYTHSPLWYSQFTGQCLHSQLRKEARRPKAEGHVAVVMTPFKLCVRERIETV